MTGTGRARGLDAKTCCFRSTGTGDGCVRAALSARAQHAQFRDQKKQFCTSHTSHTSHTSSPNRNPDSAEKGLAHAARRARPNSSSQ
jgi:hypothetical protein